MDLGTFEILSLSLSSSKEREWKRDERRKNPFLLLLSHFIVLISWARNSLGLFFFVMNQEPRERNAKKEWRCLEEKSSISLFSFLRIILSMIFKSWKQPFQENGGRKKETAAKKWGKDWWVRVREWRWWLPQNEKEEREGEEEGRGRERKRDSHSLTHRMEESENFTFVWGVIMIYYVTLKRLGGSRVSLGSGRMSPETTRKRYKKDSENERWKREREGNSQSFDLDEVTSDSSDWVSQLLEKKMRLSQTQ